MVDSDRKAFYELIGNVYAFYRVDCTPFSLGVWWEACRPFDFAAVRDAMSRHAVNPDNGQWLPKPADVVKLIDGGTADAALVAWAKVDRAVRSIGQYRSVVFDDPAIHACLRDMGDWPGLCMTQEDEWPFKAKEFQNRYRAYRLRGQVAPYPPQLTGIAESHNRGKGLRVDPPVLIGDAERCMVVMRGGDTAPALPMRTVAQLTAEITP